MGKRTDLQRQTIDNSKEMAPTDKCNARTGNPDRPYCRLKAGFRTDHQGNGRCFLHGGRAGRPIVTAMYSKKLTSTIQEEYDKIIEDPALVDMYAELAIMKVMFGDFLGGLKDKLESGDDIWTDVSGKGNPIVSPHAEVLMKMLDTIGRLYQKIVDTEAKSHHNLSLKQIYAIVQQIKNAMSVCGECPIREAVGSKLSELKIEKFGEN